MRLFIGGIQNYISIISLNVIFNVDFFCHFLVEYSADDGLRHAELGVQPQRQDHREEQEGPGHHHGSTKNGAQAWSDLGILIS